MTERTEADLGADVIVQGAWHISSRSSGGGGNCVEAGAVGDGTGRVAVRHSRHRDGNAFVYSRTEWDAFITSAKAGAFDFAAG